jgi:hypothetical protein
VPSSLDIYDSVLYESSYVDRFSGRLANNMYGFIDNLADEIRRNNVGPMPLESWTDSDALSSTPWMIQGPRLMIHHGHGDTLQRILRQPEDTFDNDIDGDKRELIPKPID